ncbi:DUF5134 domain-containing protein [Kitasatospora azatica]|uniref:DUF5134 domain-containing protein n=1 Tax=Kitasatospora azatica TaxID=58347 RepID=UPI00056A8D2E|nr:DUF5134 domain-containing protein [Kitasatospora azatica]
MHGPAVLSWLLALLTAATGGICLLRLRLRSHPGPERLGSRPDDRPADRPADQRKDRDHDRPGDRYHDRHDKWPGDWHDGRASDAAEAVMGLGTAAMIASDDRLPAPLWVALFGVLGAASLWAALSRRAGGRRAHRLHHAVGAAAMVYMALAMGGRPDHPGMAMAMGWPALTGGLLLYFGGYAVWAGSRLLTAGGPQPAGTALVAGPVPQACRLAMGVGMFAMLLAL